jgi:hypothetical protein
MDARIHEDPARKTAAAPRTARHAPAASPPHGTDRPIMLAAFLSLIPIFLLILLGFTLRKGGFVPAEQWRGVEQICYWLLFPALLILSLVRAELSFGALKGYVSGLFAMIVAMSLLMWLLRVPLRHWLDMRGPTYSSLFQTVTRWNGFIAMAVIDKLYGETGVTILAIAFHFWLRGNLARRIARKLTPKYGQLELNLRAAFLKTTGWMHSIFTPDPAGWGTGPAKRLRQMREILANHIQNLNDLYADPSGKTVEGIEVDKTQEE